MAVNPVETYLKDLGEIMRTGGGTAEESYYAPLENLLNEIGKKLKPKVRCVQQLTNTGAGEPDFGLFTANQFQRVQDDRPMKSQPPERGVIECKPWNDDSLAQTNSAQISKYWDKYGLVLVTNYHDFVLIGRDTHGKPARLESYRLAGSAAAFRSLMAHPQKAAKEQGERLIDFLRRAILHNAPLTDPQDLAWFLGSYAREARARVEAAADLPALGGLKKALEEALGMKFEGSKGEHFFRSTLVQTLFYGIFSSWVLWSRDHGNKPDERFSWRQASWTLHVPMIATLFVQIATPQKLKPLRVDEVLDWAGLALDRVDREAFFAKFGEEHVVQYFYEPFLQAYDPELRKDLGVWYTPPEIVRYQVERVDRVLREDLDVSDGLADDQVVILDPCCGTGAYLVETLKRIKRTLDEKGKSALTAQKLKHAVMDRILGFEILPAPFVVSHLQIGLVLRSLGAPLNREGDERAGVYLTNALTGWEPPEKPKDELPLFPELMEERDRANHIKREVPILVVLGNPPYNAFAGTSPEEEGGLVEPYKEGLTTPVKDGGWGIRKFNLDDLYVRFFRVAERRIVKSGKGIVSYISNFSYLGDPSFVLMRKRFLEEFDRIWIDCMNGDSRETGKLTPEGKPDPSVFSTDQSPVGIRVGTAICIMARKEKHAKQPKVLFKQYWGVKKRRDLLGSLEFKNFDHKYQTAKPAAINRYSFRPSIATVEYLGWPTIPNLAGQHAFNGPIERRNNSLIVFPDEKTKIELLIPYLDSSKQDNEIENIAPAFMKSSGEFDAKKTRKALAGKIQFKEQSITRYPFKPFDQRIAYLDPEIAPLFSRPAPQLLEQSRIKGNRYFITRDTADKIPEGVPFIFSSLITDYDCLSGHARHFPIFLKPESSKRKAVEGMNDMFVHEEGKPNIMANLSKVVRSYFAQFGIADPDKDAEKADLIWMHALAIGYSPEYLKENSDGVCQDWPRIPLPKTKNALFRSVELGRQVAAFLETEKPIPGVTTGKIEPMIKSIGVISKVGGGSLNPNIGELDVIAGWGHAGKDGVCMPGKGKYALRKQKEEGLMKAFGEEAIDVYLNDVAHWANIPRKIWEFYIGGYQVIKKWLSYREKTILGRGLKIEEAEYVTEMARRLAALILIQLDLDANYQAVKADTWPWPKE